MVFRAHRNLGDAKRSMQLGANCAVAGVFFFLAGLLAIAPTLAKAQETGDLGSWKEVGKLSLPAVPMGILVAPDNRFIYVTVAEQRKRNSGGFGPGLVTIFHFRCYEANSSKEVFAREMGQLGPRMAVCSTRLALADGFDKVAIFDVTNWTETAKIDTRSANDSPPEKTKGIPAGFGDFGGGGRLGDIEFTTDGKTLVSVRMDTTDWKKTPNGFAWTSETFQNITFWDAETGKKLAALACEDKLANNGRLHFLPSRKEMLVTFDNGVRLLDVSARKWGKIMPVKDVYSAAVSPDEKTLAVTGRDQSVKLLSLDTGSQLASFKVTPINKTPRLDGSLTPNGYEFGPSVQFVDSGKGLRVTLNDGKTVVYRSAANGTKIDAPKTVALKFPGAPTKLLTVSEDQRCAVTTTVPPSGKCTVWMRGLSVDK